MSSSQALWSRWSSISFLAGLTNLSLDSRLAIRTLQIKILKILQIMHWIPKNLRCLLSYVQHMSEEWDRGRLLTGDPENPVGPIGPGSPLDPCERSDYAVFWFNLINFASCCHWTRALTGVPLDPGGPCGPLGPGSPYTYYIFTENHSYNLMNNYIHYIYNKP